MINILPCFKEMVIAPARRIGARVELYQGSTLYENSTLLGIFSHSDALKSFSIERIGEDGKFFGFGVCQKLQVTLADKERAINIIKGNYLEVEFGVGSEYMYPYPLFRVEDVKRNENNNDITVIAYDPIYDSARHKVSDLPIGNYYTIGEFAIACASLMGLPLKIDPAAENSFATLYAAGANFDGSETVREALNAIAEATQTIYFINHEWELTFKRLDVNGEPVLSIDKSRYFNLNNKTSRTLTTICHATELGDNVSAGTNEGVTQYVRNNPFWELRQDIGTLVDNALEAIGGITIDQFECQWRGDFSLEIGDKISLTTKDNKLIYAYVLNDTISFNGGFREKTAWTFTDHDTETPSNPTSLGEALKNTYARVDKVNQRIDIVAEKTDSNGSNIATLLIDTSAIKGSVSEVEKKINENTGAVESLSKKVDLQLTPEAVQIQIDKSLENGTDKVQTSTGYRFDDEGMTVSKAGKEMSTTITEDGMTVKRNEEEVLVANSGGCKAVDLEAINYLIIGNSRFEDYSGDRTACFWIGEG